MKNWSVRLLAGVAAVGVFAAPASATLIDFDGITTGATVDTYYAGGTSSVGDVGPDYGVTFQTGDWLTATGFGETSQPNLAYSSSGAGTVNFLNGISGALAFTYGGFQDATLSFYSGLNGTGTLLASYLLPANDPNNFSAISLLKGGTAHSVGVSAPEATFGWDDLSFGGAVPEPSSWAMMLLGFGTLGAALRQRSRTSIKVALRG